MSISVKIASLFKKYYSLSLSLLEPKYSGVVILGFFSEIGMEFGLDTNFHSLSFLSQQHIMFQ